MLPEQAKSLQWVRNECGEGKSSGNHKTCFKTRSFVYEGSYKSVPRTLRDVCFSQFPASPTFAPVFLSASSLASFALCPIFSPLIQFFKFYVCSWLLTRGKLTEWAMKLRKQGRERGLGFVTEANGTASQRSVVSIAALTKYNTHFLSTV